MNLHFIHGFLGLPTDWEIFKNSFDPHTSYYHSIENYISNDKSAALSLTSWAELFNKHVFDSTQAIHQRSIDQVEKYHKKPNVVIGYSLGGRLALHSIAQQNHHWDAAIIISAHPGLTNQIERDKRLLNDQMWSQRFLSEPWNVVMNDWNQQPVFLNQKNSLIRSEKNYDRAHITTTLSAFSLGKQIDFTPMLNSIEIPILWISGDLDTKFSLIAKNISTLNKKIQCVSVSNAGHRVPWENPNEFRKICNDFLSHSDHIEM